MRTETASHVRGQVLSNAFFNALINGWLAWLLVREDPVLRLWGSPSFGVDLIATGFLLPFIIALIVIPLNRRSVSRGRVAALRPDPRRRLHRWLLRWPRNLFLRALLFGLIGALLVAPLTLLTLAILGKTEFSPVAFASFKGVWAGALAGAMVFPMATMALATRE